LIVEAIVERFYRMIFVNAIFAWPNEIRVGMKAISFFTDDTFAYENNAIKLYVRRQMLHCTMRTITTSRSRIQIRDLFFAGKFHY